MANTKISAFTSGAPAQSGDEFVIARAGANFKLAGSDIKTLAVGAGDVSVASTKTLTASNTLTLAGTDGTTMTFPSTSATLARTDAGNTFTGNQTVNGGTITADAPVLNMSQTWNNAAVTFAGLKLNVTDTTSAAASLLMDLQVGGESKFSISKTGATQYKASGSIQVYAQGRAGQAFTVYSPAGVGLLDVQLAGINIRNVGAYAFGNGNDASGGGDTFLTRRAAANLRFGAADAAAPVAQTLSVQSVVAGTTNTAGTDLTITGSQGTGTGAGGRIVFQVAPAGSSGSAQNALATALTIAGNGAITTAAVASGNCMNIGGNANFNFNGTSLTMGNASLNGNGGGFISVGDAGLFRWGASNDVVLARDAANTLALRNGTAAQAFRVYNTFTDATTFERANIFWDSNVLKIGTEKGSVGGTARALELQTDGTTRLTISTTGNATHTGWCKANLYFDAPAASLGGNGGIYFGATGTGAQIQATAVGVLALANYAGTDFSRLQFGGATSSFPALKRSTTILQTRLADDSAFATIQGKLRADVNAVAETPTATHTITITDAAGTAYKVLCVAA